MSTKILLHTLLLSALLLAPAAAATDRTENPNPPASPKTGPETGDETGVPAIRRPQSGQQAPTRASMAAWHRRYRRLAKPVKRALAEFMTARQRYRPHQLEPECRTLDRTVKTFHREAREREVFPVAAAAADLALKRLYGQIAAAAEACLDGRWGAVEGHLHRAGRYARQAELALRGYGVEP